MTTRYARGISAHVPWEQAKGAPDEALKEPAPRRAERYECARGHRFTLPFAAEAEVPPAWDCPRCGGVAHLEGTEGSTERPRLAAYPAYPTAGAGRYERPRDGLSHRQFLAMRRTDAELEAALAEALDALKRQRGETT